MLSSFTRLPTALALAVVFWAGPAMAATQASAVVSGLSFTLVDLDPNDGVAPSISWSDPYTTVQADRSFGQVVTLLPQPDGSVQWSVSFANTVSDTRQGTASFLEALSASAPGVSVGAGGAQFSAHANVSSAGESLSSFAYGVGTFVLSPHTELRVTGVLSTAASGPGSAGFQGPLGVSADVGIAYSQASAYAEVFLGTASTLALSGGVSYTPNTNAALFPTGAYADATSPLLAASWRNEGATDGTGVFYVLVQATASELVSIPVPEPGTAGMLILGLGSIAGLGVRRSRRQPCA